MSQASSIMLSHALFRPFPSQGKVAQKAHILHFSCPFPQLLTCEFNCQSQPKVILTFIQHHFQRFINFDSLLILLKYANDCSDWLHFTHIQKAIQTEILLTFCKRGTKALQVELIDLFKCVGFYDIVLYLCTTSNSFKVWKTWLYMIGVLFLSTPCFSVVTPGVLIDLSKRYLQQGCLSGKLRLRFGKKVLLFLVISKANPRHKYVSFSCRTQKEGIVWLPSPTMK